MSNPFSSFLKIFPVGWRIFIWVVIAFISMISFFQIDSYQADKHHLNTLFLVIGIVFGIVALGIGIAAATENNEDKDADGNVN